MFAGSGTRCKLFMPVAAPSVWLKKRKNQTCSQSHDMQDQCQALDFRWQGWLPYKLQVWINWHCQTITQQECGDMQFSNDTDVYQMTIY